MSQVAGGGLTGRLLTFRSAISIHFMSELTLKVPEGTLEAFDVPADRLEAELLFAAAAKLYEANRLSAGAAAHLASVPIPVFLERLGTYGVAVFRQSPEELGEEAANA